jgi:hypothetical protein
MKNRKNFTIFTFVIIIGFIFSIIACDGGAGSNNDSNLNPLSGYMVVKGNPGLGETLIAEEHLNGQGTVSYQWYRSDTSTSLGVNILSNGTGQSYKLIEADVGKYISVVGSRAGHSGRIGSSKTGPIYRFHVDKDIAWKLYEKIFDTMSPMVDKLNDLYPLTSSQSSYQTTGNVIINGTLSGSATINSGATVSGYKVVNYMGYYGSQKMKFNFSYSNYSIFNNETIHSGTGTYDLDRSWDDSKPNTITFMECTLTWNSCKYSAIIDSKNYEGTVSILYKLSIRSTPYYSQTGSVTVEFKDGPKYTW